MSSNYSKQSRTRRMRSIRWPLVGAIVVALLIPAILTNGFVAVRGVDATTQQAANQLESVVTLKAAQLNLWLEDVQHDRQQQSSSMIQYSFLYILT